MKPVFQKIVNHKRPLVDVTCQETLNPPLDTDLHPFWAWRKRGRGSLVQLDETRGAVTKRQSGNETGLDISQNTAGSVVLAFQF